MEIVIHQNDTEDVVLTAYTAIALYSVAAGTIPKIVSEDPLKVYDVTHDIEMCLKDKSTVVLNCNSMEDKFTKYLKNISARLSNLVGGAEVVVNKKCKKKVARPTGYVERCEKAISKFTRLINMPLLVDQKFLVQDKWNEKTQKLYRDVMLSLDSECFSGMKDENAAIWDFLLYLVNLENMVSYICTNNDCTDEKSIYETIDAYKEKLKAEDKDGKVYEFCTYFRNKVDVYDVVVKLILEFNSPSDAADVA